MKLDDNSVIIYLGLAFPIYVVIVLISVCWAAAADIISFGEALEAMQTMGPLFLGYIAAVLGFAFRQGSIEPVVKSSTSRASGAQRIIRVDQALRGASFGILWAMPPHLGRNRCPTQPGYCEYSLPAVSAHRQQML